MAISSETYRVQYDGNESTTDFPITFSVSTNASGDAENIGCAVLYPTGNEEVLTVSADFTIDGLNLNLTELFLDSLSGSPDALPAGYMLTIYRDVPYTQGYDFQENETFPANDFEDALDSVTYQNQQQQEQIDRALKFPVSDEEDLSPELPRSSSRANMLLGFDEDGNAVAVSGISPDGYVSIYAYSIGDIVQYDGTIYKCTAESTGNSPTDTEYWEQYKLSDFDNDLLLSDLSIDVVALADGTVATTQPKGDGSDNVATTLYVDEAGGGAQFDLASDSYTITTPAVGQVVAYDLGTDDFVLDDRTEGAYITIGVIKAVSAANTITVATSGLVEKTGWGLTKGAKYYNSGTDGVIGTTTSNTTRCVALGVAVSTTQMLVQINPFEHQNPDNKDIGDIFPSGRTTAPAGSLACDGSVYSRTIYADLYAAVGLTWSKTWEDDEVVAAGAYRKDVAGTSLYTTVAGGTSSGTDIGDDSGVTWVAADSVFQVPDARGAHFVGAGTNATYKMADGNYYTGPAVGEFEDDQMQQITGSLGSIRGGGGLSGAFSVGSAANSQVSAGSEDGTEKLFDSANSTAQGGARTGDETRPFAAGVLWCIKASATSTGQVVITMPNTYSRSAPFKITSNTARTEIVPPELMVIEIDGKLETITYSGALDVDSAASWDTTSPTYTTAANRAGVDFYIYAYSGGYVLSADATNPSGYTTANSRKVGGFHGLVAAAGTLYAYDNDAGELALLDDVYVTHNITGTKHWLDGYVAGDPLPFSLWDLLHRPVSSPEGMVYDPGTNKWVDIYLASWDATAEKLVSENGGTIADGASSPAFHQYKFQQIFTRVKKKLPDQGEFVSLSLGSPQGVNISGATNPGTTGGHSTYSGFHATYNPDTQPVQRIVSLIGVEDATGVMWQWGREGGATNDVGSAYANAFDGNDNNVAGQHYEAPNRPFFGGSWAAGASCGSRGSLWAHPALFLLSNIGARGVAEPYSDISGVSRVTINASLNTVRTVSADYTVQAQDCETIYVDCATPSDDVEIDLVSLTGNLGRRITVRMKDSDSSTYQAIINPATDEAIAGLAANTSITLSSDRDYWTLEAGPDQWELVAGYETGSTANGRYRADSDGQLLCYENSVAASASPNTWTFPKSFVDTNIVVTGATIDSYGALILLNFSGVTAADVDWAALTTVNAGGYDTSGKACALQAIGRWY